MENWCERHPGIILLILGFIIVFVGGWLDRPV